MEATKLIWVNGKLVNWVDANIHVLSHTLHYAGGVFEGIRAYKTIHGTAIFRLEEHVDRLIFSANAVKLKLQFSRQELIEAIVNIVAVNNLDAGYIRPLIYNGYGQLGVGTKNSTEVVIACWAWDKYHKSDRGLDIKTSSYIRIHPKSTIVEAKICGHYLNGILALQELDGTKYHDALMLDIDGFVSECSSANIFLVKNGIIYTPCLGTILPGITRDFVIKLAKDLGYQVVERQITRDEVYNADEAFFTGTAIEIAYMRSLDDKIIGIEDNNSISKHIQNEFTNTTSGISTRYAKYLTLVKMI